MRAFVLCGFAFLLFACSGDDDTSQTPDFTLSEFTDSRDGSTYATVKIGPQVWFAENLNYDLAGDNDNCYDDNDSNCFVYGRLYRPDDVQTACPDGWHVPSEDEWNALLDYLGGLQAATFLVGVNSTLQGNDVNFSLLPSGWKLNSTTYEFLGDEGYYWTSTAGNTQFATTRFLRYEPNSSLSFDQESAARKMSCRCVRD